MERMGKRILVVTVGGSCAPIVNAITSEQYDKVFFVCSKGGRAGSERQVDGEGRPCSFGDNDENRPSIVAQAGLDEERYEKWVLGHDAIDDLDRCYAELKRRCAEMVELYPDAEVVANFTGGTKTMSAALTLVAISFGWDLALNQGLRRDCHRVTGGDVAVPVSAGSILEDRYLSLFRQAFAALDYSMAQEVASAFLKIADAGESKRRWLELRSFAEGLSLWDRFQYADALGCLEMVPHLSGEYLGALRGLAGKDEIRRGYMVVFDLVNNARRRAMQGRFDDAVARLYRATELMAQTRLKERFGWNSGEIPFAELKERLPGEEFDYFRKRVIEGKGILQTALHDTYRLLDLLGDPVGRLFMEQESRILDVLKVRNLSFLAHGFEPIGTEKYVKVANVIEGFLDHAAKIACPDILKRAKQLPGGRAGLPMPLLKIGNAPHVS